MQTSSILNFFACHTPRFFYILLSAMAKLSSGSPMRETRVQSLGQEDALEEGMTIHSSILAWEIPWTEEPGRTTIHRVAEDLDLT